jgi:hypothetical protein
VARSRATDDFATIRGRIEELRRTATRPRRVKPIRGQIRRSNAASTGLDRTHNYPVSAAAVSSIGAKQGSTTNCAHLTVPP